MSIWTYADVSKDEFPFSVKALVVREGSEEGRRVVDLWDEDVCPFCKAQLTPVVSEPNREVTSSPPKWPEHREFFSARVEACTLCGWWKAQYSTGWSNPAGTCFDLFQGGACLKKLDSVDLSIPVREVRDYLTVQYEQRFSVNPRLFEEVVGSVFSDLGYNAVVTGYSGDDGIDVILSSGTSTIGIQVKRYKNKIGVEQIRSLAGALVLGGFTKGVFVTTSSFESGAFNTAERLSSRGYRIELLDAPRFYDALCLSQRNMYRSWEEFRSLGAASRLPQVVHIMDHF